MNPLRIGQDQVGVLAVQMARAALSDFNMLGSQVEIRYTATHDARPHKVAWVHARIRSLSGIKQSIDIPMIIRDGSIYPPELFVHDGQPRILAQSSFDDVVKAATLWRTPPDRRHWYQLPSALKLPEQAQVPLVSEGIFGRCAQQDPHRMIGGLEAVISTLLSNLDSVVPLLESEPQLARTLLQRYIGDARAGVARVTNGK